LHAQSFQGLEHDNNTITQVFSNPAFAANDDAYQVNVLGFSFLGDNNAFSYDKAAFSSYDNKIPGTFTRYVWVNADVLGPAVSFKIKKKYSFAVTTRARFLFNVDNFSGDLFRSINAKNVDTSYLYKITNMSVTTQVFSEINFIYSGYLYQSEDFNVQGGVAVKYLKGIGAAGFGATSGHFKLDENNNTHDFTGSAVNIAFTPYTNTWLSSGQPAQSLNNYIGNTGLGLDLGFVYNYTPTPGVHTNHEGYTYRLAMSITDIGSVNYSASSTTGSYVGLSDTFDYNKVNKDPNRTYGQIINQYVVDSVIRQVASKKTFKMGLPTALHIDADAKLSSSKHYSSFLNINLLINLRKPSASNFVTHYTTTGTISPRFLWKGYGFGVPFTFNTRKQGFLGLVLYAGPFYIGTSTFANYAITGSLNSVDVFLGLSFRIPGKKAKLY
jgi:hypothetical protein